MAVWQIRAGGRSQLADAFVTQGRVRLGFGLRDVSLLEFSSQEAVQEWLNIHAPGEWVTRCELCVATIARSANR